MFTKGHNSFRHIIRKSLTKHFYRFNSGSVKPRNVIIMGAAGRDFHNFNMKFRDNPAFDVKAFTAAQIPGIDDRRYPPGLCGALYPNGIPIDDEVDLKKLIEEHSIDDVIFSYSDISNDHVMHIASQVMTLGCNFTVLGKSETQLKSTKPCVSVTASRTGCGKSQTSRYVVEALKKRGLNVVALRHPMPYGDLTAQRVQKFAEMLDLDLHDCTIEEREEYEPYIERNCVVFSGVDYEAILREAEKEADIILWDGGNNDMSFLKSDIEIAIVDPHRPGHECSYYPGQANVIGAHIVLINKVDTASLDNIMLVHEKVEELNPNAIVIEAASPITVKDTSAIRNKRVLVVEDGPTLTHGGMKFGAGMVAAKKYGATIVDPRPYITGSLHDTFNKYPHIGHLLPAMGYGNEQMMDLEDTINSMAEQNMIDAVVSGTPIDISRVVDIEGIPIVRVSYDLQCIGGIELETVIFDKLNELGL